MTYPRQNNTPFWLLLIGIALILLSDSLLSEGMFVDGVTYASISRNMAEGQGAFWNPFYTQTLYPEFRQHPPLALGLEALMFKALGDHLFVERLYSVLTFIICGWLIAAIWKRTTNRPNQAWLPLLFWMAMPLTAWSATNNLLENTMTVFVLLTVYLLIISYQSNKKVVLFLSALPLLCASLSKGFTGLFPLVFPIVYCIFDDKRHWIQGPVDTSLLMVALAVLAGVMFLVFPASLPYLKDYFNLQVIGGGLHEPTVGTRFYIVFQLLLQCVVPIIIVIGLLLLRKVMKTDYIKVFEFSPDRKWFFVFLILGLCGVLPIMLSVKQRDFYMLTALPFFALAFGHLSLAMANAILLNVSEKHRKGRLIGSIALLLVGIVLNVCRIGKYGRDEALIEDVKKRIAEADGKTIIDISPEEYTNWAEHAYFMRYGKISLCPTEN
ncbi:MAG: glycosyltransferase family 39 protein [Bacteroidales bacterium]|nr:glycosyltransferase family 39 protein [Bacteroidales bacterium]